jgi:hypothetical protein
MLLSTLDQGSQVESGSTGGPGATAQHRDDPLDEGRVHSRVGGFLLHPADGTSDHVEQALDPALLLARERT